VKIEEKNLINSYALTKYLAEKYLIENLPKDIKLTILRPRAIY
jgi:nucleoside-diphosphate-sugar epimerase